MKVNKLAICLALAAMLLATAAPARSDCTQSGALVYSYISSTTSPITAYFYLGSGSGPTIYYWTKTTDPEMIRYLATAQAGRRHVTITGNAATCPTTGTARNMGVVKKAVIYTKY